MNVNVIQNQNDNAPSPPDYENILVSDLGQLSPNICTDIMLNNNTINYLTTQQLTELLSKMRHGGTVSISSLDAVEITKAFYFDKINISQFSSLISNQQSQHSLIELKTFFEQNQYKIENAHINDLSFYLKVRRP